MACQRRPEGTYCAVCGAMLLEENPTECDKCGALLFWIVSCCPGFVELYPLEAIDADGFLCSECGRKVSVEELTHVDFSDVPLSSEELPA